MILADTSVWAEFFRGRLASFAPLLDSGEVFGHVVVIGELALGNLPKRSETLVLLSNLPRAVMADFEECLALIERHHLWGTGIGWSDVQLLASAKLSDASLWTLDKPLLRAAALAEVPLYSGA